MPKKYKLLIDSPELKKGIEVSQQGDGAYIHILPEGTHYRFSKDIIENRPTVWQEIVEEQEKKVVERWRGEGGQYYYAMDWKDLEKCSTANTALYDNGNYFRTSQVATRARQRTEIMCRLMGLAETIEEGSTEMKGAWTIGFDTAKDMDLIPIYTNNTVLNTSKLATFNTKENTQLFLDSAGQDAIDWYGEVK